MADSNPPKQSTFVRFTRHVRARLIAGILVVVPLWFTWKAILFAMRQLDKIFAPSVEKWFGGSIPGLGFVLLVVFLYLIGVIARNIVGRSLIAFGESILQRIPLVKNIYQATKQLLQTISMSRTMGFQRVVFVDYPRPGLKAIAFVTNVIEDPKEKKRFVTVFIPTTPNPTSGVFELVPEAEAIDSGLTIEQGIKMVISGGLMVPAHFNPEVSTAKELL